MAKTDSPLLLRSVLYVPASKERALQKAATLDCDAVIIDLEDSVAPTDKLAARDRACAVIAAGTFADRFVVLRVNGLDSEWHDDDMTAARSCGAGAILVSKVESADQARAAVARSGGVSIWTMIETPRAVLCAEHIAAVDGVGGLVAGFEDLKNALHIPNLPAAAEGGLEDDVNPALDHARSKIIYAARAHGVVALDGVYADFNDDSGLERATRRVAAMGYDGKTLIHPGQIATANRVFAPTDRDVAHARKLIAACAATQANCQGVLQFEGRMVEELHLVAARRLVARADAIAARGAGRSR